MSGPRSIWENYFRPSGEPQTSFEYYVRRQITLFKLIHTLIYYETLLYNSQQNAEAKWNDQWRPKHWKLEQSRLLSLIPALTSLSHQIEFPKTEDWSYPHFIRVSISGSAPSARRQMSTAQLYQFKFKFSSRMLQETTRTTHLLTKTILLTSD